MAKAEAKAHKADKKGTKADKAAKAEARKKTERAALRGKITKSKTMLKKKEGVVTKAERFLKRVENAEKQLHAQAKKKKRENWDKALLNATDIVRSDRDENAAPAWRRPLIGNT